MRNHEISAFVEGVENVFGDRLIGASAASDSLNFYNADGRLILIPGKRLIGAAGVAGSVTGEWFGYRVNGTQVHWRKIGTVIQYDSGTPAVPVWTTVITGLTASADYSFTNYSSLAGSFTFAVGVDGIFKMNNANPASYIALYNSAKNFKGKAFIDKGRMILWDVPNDKTSIRGSHIDPQNSTVYTAVTGEATTSLTGTLAFKAGGATRNAFGIAITLTGTGEVYTDNFLGVLTGSLGGMGTINYITGAYTLSNAGVGTAAYQWEDSNVKGLTDFTRSATRLAGEGFIFPQDEGGDPILNVVIGPDGYYSMKENSSYLLTLDADDLGASNNVFRKQMGTLSYRGSLSTSQGIIFINTNNPEKPEMTILVPNLAGDSLVPKVLFPQFRFANYLYDDCTVESFERYIIVACRTPDSTVNDRILLCDLTAGTVNITNYHARTLPSCDGLLYMGSSIVQSVYQLFSGFDDDGYPIQNYWIGKGEIYAPPSKSASSAASGQSLKKLRRIRLKGGIALNQSYQVYLSYDDAGFQLVGTVLGTGSYVDYASPQTIGSNFIGEDNVGGGPMTNIYPYFIELHLEKVPKFRKRSVKFIALGIGYVSIAYQMDVDITLYEEKLPRRFRQKQNVSLGGLHIEQDSFMLREDGAFYLNEDSSEILHENAST